MADAISLSTLPQATRFIVRGDPAAFASVFGVALPTQACRAAVAGDRAALWLGPDEWLVLMPDGASAPMTASGSVVEVSDRQVAFAVSGPRAVEVINAYNALDLHIETFPVGMCTRTLFGKAEIVLWRTGADAFHVEVWRSFAPYVQGCLEEAAREYA